MRRIPTLLSVFRTGDDSAGSAIDYLASRIGGMSVSSRIAAPATSGTDANIQTNLIALTGYPGRNAVLPMWRALELIREPYSGAASGEVAITRHALYSFKILREAGWSLYKTRTA